MVHGSLEWPGWCSGLCLACVGLGACAWSTTALAAEGGGEGAVGAALEDVVVTSGIGAVRREEAPAGYGEITREDIKRRPVTTLDEILRETPGVDTTAVRGGRDRPQIRGLEPRHTLMLINGRRLNNTDELFPHNDFRTGAMPPISSIERIEVVRNPASAVHGADALGGVINVITRPPTDEWQGTATARYGTLDSGYDGEEQHYSLFAGGPLGERWGAIASLEFVDTEPSLLPDHHYASEEDYYQEGREALSGYASLFYDPAPGHEFEFFLSAGEEERTGRSQPRDELPPWQQMYSEIRGLDELGEEPTHVDLTRYAFGAAYALERTDWDGEVQLYRSRVEAEEPEREQIREFVGWPPAAPGEPPPPDQDEVPVFELAPREMEHTEDVAQARGGVWWSDRQRLSAIVDYRRETFEREVGGEPEVPRDRAHHYGVGLENRSYLLGDRLLVTLGARLDGHSEYSGGVSPRVSGVYAVNDEVRVKADYAEGFAAPNLLQLSGDYEMDHSHMPVPEAQFYLYGNPDLDPERSRSYSLALERTGQHSRQAITLFRTEVEDQIVEQRTGEERPDGAHVRRYDNIEEARTKGVELEAGWRWPDGSRIRGSYTYLAAHDRETGDRLENRPRQRAHLLAETPPWSGALAHTRVEHVGDQVGVGEPYTLLHLGLRQQLPAGITVGIGVENATDERPYRTDPERVGLDADDADDFYGTMPDPVRGRFYYVSAELEW
ncbi:TonB-dependent receptor [Halorhodospira sp. 9621]|uniref:TonB-dependent receptor plug domain-containing protein n=1 Tax=Halorhodospira sp. 9621 TaxID=2899135 RepID=UPI001EE7D116|nr:TonB-dependent receptor [Halorhodospira sp. 9621]MCG5533909.1 TonB-dependent receptor [Halorhodospira sp. 9621]